MTFNEKVEAFAEVLRNDITAHMNAQGFTGPVHDKAKEVFIRPGKKYIKVDVETSGRYMVEEATDIIYGVKGYGVINKAKTYGTLDTLQDYSWGDYTAVKKAEARKPAAEAASTLQAFMAEQSASTEELEQKVEEMTASPEEYTELLSRKVLDDEGFMMIASPEALKPAEAPPAVLNSFKLAVVKPAVKPAIKVTVLARVSDAPVSLADIVIDIQKHLETAANSALRIGGLLVLAREFHASQALFIEWAEKTVNIKKAQAYRLIKIHQEFGEDSRFTGVAMRVMNMLTGQPAEVVQAAATLASAGKLDSKAAEQLTGKVSHMVDITPKADKPATIPPVKAEEPEDAEILEGTEGQDQDNYTDEQDREGYTIDPDFDAEELPPFDTGVSAPVFATVAPEQSSTVSDTPSGLTDAQINAMLEARVEELEEALRVANARIEELSKPLPVLPQFDKSLPCIVLGLDDIEAQNVAEVRAAYRALAAIWTPEASPEAFKLLTEARDTLLAELKA